jgi:hypothetical protein
LSVVYHALPGLSIRRLHKHLPPGLYNLPIASEFTDGECDLPLATSC